MEKFNVKYTARVSFDSEVGRVTLLEHFTSGPVIGRESAEALLMEIIKKPEVKEAIIVKE